MMNKKLKRSKNNSSESKNIPSESRTSQEFKNQEEFETQDLKNQDQDSRLKILERRKDSIKISIKKFFKTLNST